MTHSPPFSAPWCHSADVILFTTQHVKSQVISQQRFNLWKVHSQAGTGITFIARAIRVFFFSLNECRAVNTLNITIPCGHAMTGGWWVGSGSCVGGLNQFPADVFLLFAPFDLEFTFICSTAPRSKCHGCLRHSKPQYQKCPMRSSPFGPKF